MMMSLRILFSAVPMWDVAIGERRAVVQDELLVAGAGLLNLAVETGGLPFLETLGFARHQIGFHGKVGARQIERVFVVHRQSFKGADATKRGTARQARQGTDRGGPGFASTYCYVPKFFLTIQVC